MVDATDARSSFVNLVTVSTGNHLTQKNEETKELSVEKLPSGAGFVFFCFFVI